MRIVGRYIIVGGGGFIIGYLLIYLPLVYWFDVRYTWASAIMDWSMYALAFPAHKFWTFESKELYKAWWQLPAHFALKVFWNSPILVPFLLVYLDTTWGMEPWSAKIAAAVLVGFFQNMPVCKYVIFNQALVDWTLKQKNKL